MDRMEAKAFTEAEPIMQCVLRGWTYTKLFDSASLRLATDFRASQNNYQEMENFAYIHDDYTDMHQVTEALEDAGLESSNLIVGIDFTKSNEWTGKHSFDGLSLHTISPNFQNPYQQAISIIGKTLARFDEDNLIPCYGFGDVTTHDQKVFNLDPSGQPCVGIEGVLQRYKERLPRLILSGPTSFAPIINAAIEDVRKSGGQYHILVIVADGQVTGNMNGGRLSVQEKATMDAIVHASNYPLSIVLVGVGDGPWDLMKRFDDAIPKRKFDNFQFVNFTEVMSQCSIPEHKEAQFAVAALMEIPQQYKAIKHLLSQSCKQHHNDGSTCNNKCTCNKTMY